jgi:hypothetical protein
MLKVYSGSAWDTEATLRRHISYGDWYRRLFVKSLQQYLILNKLQMDRQTSAETLLRLKSNKTIPQK